MGAGCVLSLRVLAGLAVCGAFASSAAADSVTITVANPFAEPWADLTAASYPARELQINSASRQEFDRISFVEDPGPGSGEVYRYLDAQRTGGLAPITDWRSKTGSWYRTSFSSEGSGESTIYDDSPGKDFDAASQFANFSSALAITQDGVYFYAAAPAGVFAWEWPIEPRMLSRSLSTTTLPSQEFSLFAAEKAANIAGDSSGVELRRSSNFVRLPRPVFSPVAGSLPDPLDRDGGSVARTSTAVATLPEPSELGMLLGAAFFSCYGTKKKALGANGLVRAKIEFQI
jgi:hypothetical protein